MFAIFLGSVLYPCVVSHQMMAVCQAGCTTHYRVHFITPILIVSNPQTFHHTPNINSQCQKVYFFLFLFCLIQFVLFKTSTFFIRGIRFLILQSNKMFQRTHYSRLGHCFIHTEISTLQLHKRSICSVYPFPTFLKKYR